MRSAQAQTKAQEGGEASSPTASEVEQLQWILVLEQLQWILVIEQLQWFLATPVDIFRGGVVTASHLTLVFQGLMERFIEFEEA